MYSKHSITKKPTTSRSIWSGIYNLVLRDEDNYTAYTDEWGIAWRMPKEGGFYYDMHRHPLADAETIAAVKDYTWPAAADPHRFE